MRIRRPLLAGALAALTALSGTGATAQVPFLGGTLKSLAYQAAAKQLAPVVSEASPIDLNWNNLYPTVEAPPGGPFRASGDPRKIREQQSYLLAQMAKNPNAPIPLRPGDYVFFMRAYCTHAGPQAIPAHPQEPWPEYFQLAPLKGRRASVLPALYGRAQQAHIPYRQTQSLVWSITNGVPFETMPPEQQRVFTKLVPQYRGLMEGDPVQRIRDRWTEMRRKMPLLPTLDAAVDKLGSVGTTIRSLEEAQRATIANAGNFEQSKATLAPMTIMSPAPVPVKSWSKLSDRVYAKIKIPRNYHGIGSIVALFVRVLPASAAVSAEHAGASGDVADTFGTDGESGVIPATNGMPDERRANGSSRTIDRRTVASAYSDGAGTAGMDSGGSVGMPGQNGVQAVTLGPTLGDTGVGPATTGDGPPASTAQPGPPKLPIDSMYNGIQWINDNVNFWTKGTDPSEDQSKYVFGPTLGGYVPPAPQVP